MCVLASHRVSSRLVASRRVSSRLVARPWCTRYPTNTVVKGNLIHELGVFTKQVAGYFQALAVNSTVQGNIVVNGPRSGVNINDAAFGGHAVKGNLLANLVRETVDHGCVALRRWRRAKRGRGQ